MSVHRGGQSTGPSASRVTCPECDSGGDPTITLYRPPVGWQGMSKPGMTVKQARILEDAGANGRSVPGG